MNPNVHLPCVCLDICVQVMESVVGCWARVVAFYYKGCKYCVLTWCEHHGRNWDLFVLCWARVRLCVLVSDDCFIVYVDCTHWFLVRYMHFMTRWMCASMTFSILYFHYGCNFGCWSVYNVFVVCKFKVVGETQNWVCMSSVILLIWRFSVFYSVG